MKAKFIGKNGSMGFVTGRIYNIKTRCGFVYGKTPCLIVVDVLNKNSCPYSSLESMLENWELIKR